MALWDVFLTITAITTGSIIPCVLLLLYPIFTGFCCMTILLALLLAKKQFMAKSKKALADLSAIEQNVFEPLVAMVMIVSLIIFGTKFCGLVGLSIGVSHVLKIVTNYKVSRLGLGSTDV